MKTLKSWITRVSKKKILAFLNKMNNSNSNTFTRSGTDNTPIPQSKQFSGESWTSMGMRDSASTSSLGSDMLTVMSLSLGLSATLSDLLVSPSSLELRSWSSEDMAYFETEFNGGLECPPVYIAARPENQPPLYGEEEGNEPTSVHERPQDITPY